MKKHLQSLKTLVLLLVSMSCFGYVHAATEVINGVNTGTKDVDLVGTGFTLPGTYIAGNSTTLKYGGKQTIKIRCTKSATITETTSANTFVINVNEGYKITSIKAEAISNYDSGVEVAHIYVDNTETDLGLWSIDGKAGTASSISFSGFEAKEAIYFVTNAGASQILFAATITYEEITQTAAAPSISIVDGIVTITTNEPGAKTYYTTDGADPTIESTIYTEPFIIEEGKMVKAFSVKEGMKNSDISKEIYTSFSPIQGTYGITRPKAANSTQSSDGKVEGYALAAEELVDPSVEQVKITMNYPTLSGLTDKGRNIYHGSDKCYVDKGVKNYRNTTTSLGDDYYQFDLKIEDGYQLSLTTLVSDICKDADNAKYQVVILNNGIQVYSAEAVTVKQKDNAKKTIDLSVVEALQSLQGVVSVKMLWTNTANTGKYIAVKDLHVTATLSKAPKVTKYGVLVVIDPEEAGTATQNGLEFSPNSDVILTAVPNYGYEFLCWEDAERNIVSETATYQFVMPGKDVICIAKFTKLPVVTYSIKGVEGIEGTEVPNSVAARSVKIPTNWFLYKEGHTLTGWSDGISSYDVGATISVNEDMTLTPVFTENTFSLADRIEPLTITWDFQQKNGAPIVAWQGKKSVWVTQAIVNGESIDVKMDVDATKGKVANANWQDWAQINGGTILTVPSCKGTVIALESYSATTTTTIEGTVINQGTKTPSYTVTGEAETVEIVIGDGSYWRTVSIQLPKPSYKISVGVSGYSSFYANHAVSLPDGLKAYTAALNNEETELILTELENGYIPSKTGVVVRGAVGEYSLDVHAGDPDAVHSVLKGVAVRTLRTEITGDDILYALSTQNELTGFFQYTGAYIPANKAFLLLSPKANLPVVRITSFATSIESLESEVDEDLTLIFNLQGQKMQSPQTPGLYIINGKKIIIK